MANRRTSWRRTPANTQPHHRRPQKNQTVIPFPGIEDHGTLVLLTHLLAKQVKVNSKDGKEYSGLFTGTYNPKEATIIRITLRYVRLTSGKEPGLPVITEDVRGNIAAKLHIPLNSITTIIGAPFENAKRGFATDSQISRGSTGVGRQLQRFDDFTNVQTPNTNNAATVDQKTFGSLANSATRDKWDQFQVNQAKFGVTTSFDESQYTTTIDRNSKDFAERQRVADRLAEEIESAPSQNIHIREERNQEVGTNLDEEARYSGVQRPQRMTQQPVRTQVSAKDPPPEKPRLSYAAAAAAAANMDPRQHPSAKPPAAGATHAAASQSKSAPTQVKNATGASKSSTPAGSKHSQQGGKASQDQTAKHGQSASRGSHSASTKNVPPNGKVPTQTPKSGNKKGPVASNKPQQQQGKNVGSNNKSANQTSSKSSSQPLNSRPSTHTVSQKSSTSTVHARAPMASARTTTPSQSGTASQEQPQTKPATTKTTAPTAVSNKDKASEEKPKPIVKERLARDSLPQVVKVRAATLAGRTSPNQSRNSPLPTPAVADTSAIGVLNLDAQTPNLGPEQIKRFEAYKTNREFQSIAANREKITDDLKKFSTQLDSKNGSLRRSQNNGSSTPGTPRATARATKIVPDSSPTEKVPEHMSKKNATAAKEEIQKASEVQAKGVKGTAIKPADKSEESALKPRPKSRSKLNPNAQEFKLNPDAPSFTPASQKTPPQTAVPYTGYNQPGGLIEYSQQMQIPPGYAMPLQTMTPMPYGPQSYVVVPTPVASGNGSAYPFVQQAPSFGPAHVGGRFPQSAGMLPQSAGVIPQSAGMIPQSAGMPVSYGYPHVTPVVIAQPPQQRVPTSPYYHNAGPYAGSQVAPGHMAAPHQAHIYQQGAPPHLQGSTLPMTGRGGHGNPRRGGTNRSRGKTSLQQSYAHVPSGDRSAPKSP